MKLLHQSRERSWYLVKEWTTKTGLKAHIRQCVWAGPVKVIATSLHDHYTGYVEVPDGHTTTYYNNDKIDVHGGVTFENTLADMGKMKWVGFDLAHFGDEDLKDPEFYAEDQCEKLAKQIKKNHDKQIKKSSRGSSR